VPHNTLAPDWRTPSSVIRTVLLRSLPLLTLSAVIALFPLALVCACLQLQGKVVTQRWWLVC
jgi:hypothetical protein